MDRQDMEITPLTDADVHQGALRLSDQAGWNQLAIDWLRLIRRWPNSCFCMRDAGEIVATATVALYSPGIAWVGMILVDQSRRGQGIGGAMMDFVIDKALASQISFIGLDATDAGRAVYSKRGFHEQFSIDRYIGPASIPIQTSTGSKTIVRPLADRDWAAVMALDQHAVSADRLPLFQHMHCERNIAFRVAIVDGVIRGFGASRSGSSSGYVGPIVAEHVDVAIELFNVLLANLSAMGHVDGMIDVPANGPFQSYLQSRGFKLARRLMRMSLPPSNAMLLSGDAVFAIAGFELG